jgi:hypothetical protein
MPTLCIYSLRLELNYPFFILAEEISTEPTDFQLRQIYMIFYTLFSAPRFEQVNPERLNSETLLIAGRMDPHYIGPGYSVYILLGLIRQIEFYSWGYSQNGKWVQL